MPLQSGATLPLHGENFSGFGDPHRYRLVGTASTHIGLALNGHECYSRSLCGALAPFSCSFNTPMAAVSLSVSTVKPLGDRVFVKVSESEEKTAGGILLPDTAKEKPQVGEVVQVGPGKRNDDGSRQAPEVGVGDKVLYSKYAGTDIKLSTDEYVLLSEKDILAVVN